MGADRNIQIRAEVLASLSGMDKVRKELSEVFKKQKLEIGSDSNLSKLIRDYDDARQQLDSIISKGHITPDEAKKTKQLTKQVNQLYNNILGSLGKIKDMDLPDLKKIFPSNFSAKTADGLKRIAKYYSDLGSQQVKLGKLDIANTELKSLEDTLTTLQNRRTKIEVEADITQASKAIEELEQKKRELENKVYEAFSPKEKKDAQGRTQAERDDLAVENAQNQYDKMVQAEEALKKAKARALNKKDQQDLDDLQTKYNSDLSDVQIEKAQAKQIRDKLSQEIARRAGAQGKRGKGYELVEDTDLQNQYRSALDNYENLKEKESKIKNKYTQDKKAIKDRPQAELKQSKEKAKTDVETARIALEAAKETQRINKEAQESAEATARQKAKDFIEGKDDSGISPDDIQSLKEYNEQLEKQNELQKKLKTEKGETFKDQDAKDSAVSAQNLKISKKTNEILELNNALEKLASATSIDNVFNELEKLDVDTQGIDRTEQGLEQIKNSLSSMNKEVVERITASIKELGDTAEETSEDVKKMDKGLLGLDADIDGFQQQKREIEDLQQSFLHFFSIGNSIELFKRTVRESIETVKELDAVMTETAVVTDFTVGDMWEKLPLYAKQASKLGTSIKDLYGATTLYYQQGLNSDQAMNVGIETMKMARIANMEASDATTAMTAALRGFNMELNETSATRVNDVYSELAAITAADTNQIATAMGKTASIAASANMDFETTAALLAQIIETTQEAPETAGTAMKTIIARFTEVKELFSEGMLTGEDSEGEEININKIDAALKTVGISLKDFLNGTKGIDDIFLELASKWDSLDLATQRYIATMAAGSRQQSRFIAMMSNYDRTVELVTAANNSAGASQRQYEKTLDSMEAKLQKLQNAWDTFVMNLANSDALKSGIDAITWILELVNNLTEAFSGGNGLSKALLSFATAFGALKLGKGLINLVSEGLFEKKFIPDGKTIQQLSKGALQSPLALFKKQQDIELGGFLTKIGGGKTKEDIMEITSSMNKATVAAQGLGLAFGLLGGALQESGFDEAGQAVSDFGGALMTVGSIATMVAPMLASIGLTAPWLIAIIGGIAALSVGITHVSKAIHKASPEGKLEAAQTATEQAGEAANEAAEAYENLSNAIDGISSKTKDLNGLAEGTDAWKESVRELNKEVLDLVDKYPELRDFITRDEKGVLGIDYNKTSKTGQTAQDVINTYKNNAKAAKTAEKMAQASQTQAQADVDFENFKTKYKKDFGLGVNAIGEQSIQDMAIAMASGKDIMDVFSEAGYENLDTLYFSEESVQAFRDYGNTVLTNRQLYKDQLSSAAISAMDMASLDYQTGDYVRSMDEDILVSALEASVNNEEGKYETLTDAHKQQYATYRGWSYANGKFIDDQGNEVGKDLEDTMIAEYLANAEGSKIYADYLEQVNQALTRSGMGKEIGQLISNDGAGITQDLLQQISDGGIDALLGDSVINDIATAMGMEPDAFKDFVNQNVKYAQQRIDKQRAANAQKTLRFNKKMSEADAVRFAEEDGRDLQRYSDFLNSLEAMGDDSLASAAFEEYARAGVEASEKLTAFTEEINWNNPIEAAKALRLEAENGSGATKEYAEALLKVTDSSIGASAQMKYFWNTASGEDFQEDLSEIVEEQGKLTGTDILELAENYSALDDMMENTGATAEGMAKALNLIGKKDIKIDHLTDAVLASLGAFDGLNSVIYETLKNISDFDAGLDEDDIAGFISQAADTLTENVKKGAWGNSQNRKYLDFLLGPDWDAAAESEQAYEDRLTYAAKKLEKNKDNMLNSWKDLAEGKDFYGKKIAEDDLLDGKEGRLGVEKLASGGIKLTGYEGKTTDQVVKEIQEAYNVSEQYAKMMLTDFSNYSSDLMQELSSNDFVAGMEKAYEKLSQLGNKKIIDESEIKTIMELFGKTREEVIGALGGEEGLAISSFYDAEGNLKQIGELRTEIDQLWKDAGQAGNIATSAISFDQGKRIIDYQEIMSQLANLKIPEEARANLTNDIISSLNKGWQESVGNIIDYQLPSGQKIQIPLEPNMSPQDIQAAIYDASKIAEGELYGQGILKAFSAEGIELSFNTEQAKAEMAELSKPVETTLVVDTKTAEENIDQVKQNATEKPIEVNYQPVNLEEVTSQVSTSVQTADTDIRVEITNLDEIKNQIESAVPSNKTMSVSIVPQQTEIEISGAASGIISIAAHKDGIVNAPGSYPALVSEKGPELIETKDGAYLSGLDGPEVVGINKGDTVHTAEETKKILKGNRGITIPRYDGGKPGAQGYTDVKGSGNSGGKEEEKWENPFDKLYNLVRKIDEELRQRERIERRYEKLLESIDTSANKIIQVSREELAQLEKERMLQEKLIEGRKGQIDDLIKENADLTKYANVTQNDRGEDVLRINWDLINAITDTKEGEVIEEYVNKLEEWFDALTEAEDALWDIEDAVAEIKERGEDQYFDLEGMIKDALVQSYQDEIDKLNEINTSINDTNASLLDAMQKSIDKQRRDRDNQRSEDELAEKQRRLLYLQQDTSGANDMEILRLQDEIRQSQEDYTDSLIDQKISELQQQNEEAAKQREQQITIAQAQLDYAIENGLLWDKVYGLMNEGLDPANGLIRGSQLATLLKSSEGFQGMSELDKMKWLNDTNNLIAQALAYLEVGRQLEDIGVKAGTQIEFINKDGKKLTGTVDDKGNVKASDGKTYNNVFQGADGRYYSEEDIPEVKQPVVEMPKETVSSATTTITSSTSSGSTGSTEPTKPTQPPEEPPEEPPVEVKKKYTATRAYKRYVASSTGVIQKGYGAVTADSYIDQQAADNLAEAYKAAKEKESYNNAWSLYRTKYMTGGGASGAKQIALTAFATGGMADFTGPAWLDGSKSKPELILNARDTENFIQLKDILGSLLNRSGNTSSENNGDITYDIDINVESIGSDYDVEQVANKVKSMIGENGRYRNNNAISLKR